MSRSIGLAFAGALALAAASLSAAPASAMPVPAPLAAPAATDGATVDQVYYRRGFGFHRRFGYRRPFFRRGYGYGYRRGLPGHPIRRILRAL